MAEKASLIAKLGLGLGLAGTVLSGYQLWTRHWESRIAAAIEISKSYLQDQDIENHRRALLTYLPAALENKDRKFQNEIITYFRRLDYLAFLINQSWVNADYVAATLKCDIALASLALQGTNYASAREIRSFGKDKKLCPFEELPQSN